MVSLGGSNLSMSWVGTEGTRLPESDRAARSTHFDPFSMTVVIISNN